jgi:hypothetical protein
VDVLALASLVSIFFSIDPFLDDSWTDIGFRIIIEYLKLNPVWMRSGEIWPNHYRISYFQIIFLRQSYLNEDYQLDKICLSFIGESD